MEHHDIGKAFFGYMIKTKNDRLGLISKFLARAGDGARYGARHSMSNVGKFTNFEGDACVAPLLRKWPAVAPPVAPLVARSFHSHSVSLQLQFAPLTTITTHDAQFLVHFVFECCFVVF